MAMVVSRLVALTVLHPRGGSGLAAQPYAVPQAGHGVAAALAGIAERHAQRTRHP